MKRKNNKFILWFNELGIKDVPIVGGKNASLGEMYCNLTKKGVNIPNGFAVTAYAYKYFIDKAGLHDYIENKIKTYKKNRDVRVLRKIGNDIRQAILKANIPKELEEKIKKNYDRLSNEYHQEDVDVAVRSSATAEDLPTASFAGQQETYLNIRGYSMLIEAVKKCFASLFTDRAISYREDKGFDHFKVLLSVGIQKMVRSDLSASGVMFTLDTETGFKDVVFITAIYGLGENIVQGAVNPDEYYVFKPTLKKGYKAIINKKLEDKQYKMIYALGGIKTTKNIPVSIEERNKFVLTDEEILTLARWGITIEDHYSRKHKKWTPMDIEWAKDGISGKLFIVQARPETVQSQKHRGIYEVYKLRKRGKILTIGRSVGSKIGKGKARIIKNASEIHKFKKGEILVTDMTDPDWEPIMKIASAIVTNRGGRTCHSAIVSRELGIPCVVGTGNATSIIKTGQHITVSCAEGENGYVYDGLLDFIIEKHDLKKIKMPKVKITMNLGNPEQAFELSFLPNDGVGLAREEFIINSYIKIHPNALINYNNLKNKELKKQIDDITKGYKDKKQFYIEKLAYGIAMIAAAFYPKKVILRFSDFKTNEYANLIGGQLYEPKEDNPMLGWRGASRYYSKHFIEAFGLECKAVRKVREEIGLTNLEVMIPMCRSLEEARKVLKTMERYGLKRGRYGLKVNVMCEVPSNVILADDFLNLFDGFSIGSNDLTQFTLACDRDSELIAHVYDERNDAVKTLIKTAIKIAKKKKKYIGICGDAPSTFPDFTDFLIKEGIESISLSPDAILPVITRIKRMR